MSVLPGVRRDVRDQRAVRGEARPDGIREEGLRLAVQGDPVEGEAVRAALPGTADEVGGVNDLPIRRPGGRKEGLARVRGFEHRLRRAGSVRIEQVEGCKGDLVLRGSRRGVGQQEAGSVGRGQGGAEQGAFRRLEEQVGRTGLEVEAVDGEAGLPGPDQDQAPAQVEVGPGKGGRLWISRGLAAGRRGGRGASGSAAVGAPGGWIATVQAARINPHKNKSQKAQEPSA